MRETDEIRDPEIGAALQDLPIPGISDGFFRRLSEELLRAAERPREVAAVHIPERQSAVRRRVFVGSARPALIAAAVAILVAVPAGFALRSSVSADPDTDPVNVVTTFEPAPDWNTVVTTFGPSGQKLSIAWAANVPFKSEEDITGFPSKTIRMLPSDGIVMTAIGPRSYTGDENFPAIIEPLDLSQGHCVLDQYEGQPAPNVSKCMINTMVGDRVFNVLV